MYMRNKTEYSVQYQEDMKQNPPIINELYDVFVELRKDVDHYNEDSVYRYFGRSNCVAESFDTKTHNYRFNTLGVLFCGKYYPVLRCQRIDKNTIATVDKTDWFYTADDLCEFLTSHGQDLTKISGRWDKKNTREKIDVFFAPKQVNTDWMIERKVTCVVYERYNNKIIINPPLVDYGFYKVMDPYTAYQELSMWLEGTLAWPFNMMVEVGDKSKVLKHGFDPKYGFRTRPK